MVSRPLAVVVCGWVAVALLGCGGKNQQLNRPVDLTSTAVMPLDPRVRSGTLDNGLRYFVLRHNKPADRALLWLAVDAGSVLEDDDQRGLAHFVEHMAFNGTKLFKKQKIVDFIERIGMRFGADLNAYTSFDQTVYMLKVPTRDTSALNKGFLILKDWASGIRFAPEEIEKERGVVLEEWRKGLGAQRRVMDKQFSVLLHKSRYAQRLPIGLPDVIQKAPRSAFLRFYKDWYRPDMMAVVIVGNVDVDEMERRIKTTFAPLTKAENPRKRPVYLVPPHAQTLVTAVTDKELTTTSVQLIHKLPHRPVNSQAAYRKMLLERLYAAMLNDRFSQMRLLADAPFLGARASRASWIRPMDAFVLGARVKSDGVAAGVQALATEVARVTRWGFSQAELNRARANFLRLVQRAVVSRNKLPARNFAREILRYHFAGEAMPGAERELQLTKAILSKVKLAEVNGLAGKWIKESSRVIAVAGPEGMQVPPDDKLIALATPGPDAKIAQWRQAGPDVPMMASAPKPGKVVKEETLAKLGVTRWTLSNGAVVWIKPTQFKNDQVLFRAFSAGGHSLATDATWESARRAGGLVGAGGVGKLSGVQLRHALAGKVASVRPYIRELDEGLKGAASPKDLETMLQLAHQRFVAPRKDTEMFAAWKRAQIDGLTNRNRNPKAVFFDHIQAQISRQHPRRQAPTQAALDKVDLDQALAFYKARFADAGDFTFLLVGNVQTGTLKPLVEKYLASLPGRGVDAKTGITKSGGESWRDIGVDPIETGKFSLQRGLSPKAFVLVYFAHAMDAKWPWSLDAEDDAAMVAAAMRIRLREVLREDMGGVYGVRVGVKLSRLPKPRATTYIAFDCAPDNVDKLHKAVLQVSNALRDKPVTDAIVTKIKTNRKRALEVALQSNRYWLGKLKIHAWHGTDPSRILATEERVKRVTAKRIQTTAKRLLTPKKHILATLLPQKKAQ